MITVFLCDDNQILLARYRTKLSALAKKYNEDVAFSQFCSGENLLFHLEDNPNEADIIFLDILMGELNGIETAKQLRNLGCISEIIFLTSSEDFVFESFDTAPLHYIIKGTAFEDKKIQDVFFKALSAVKEKETEVFLLETGGQKKKIPLHKISFFEIQGRVITVHFGAESISFYSSMDTLTEELEKKKFVRCHKSFLVNLTEILRQYFINHPQSIDKYTFLQNSAFTHWVKEKCSKMC